MQLREVVGAESKKAAQQAAKELRAEGPKRSGVYAKGWGYSSEKVGLSSREFTVHNKKKPSLTHLLEFGHANRGGGRTPGRAHIGPVYEKTGEQLEKNIKKGIESL